MFVFLCCVVRESVSSEGGGEGGGDRVGCAQRLRPPLEPKGIALPLQLGHDMHA